MHPGLIERRRLRVTNPAPDRGRAPLAASGLVVALVAAGLASAVARTPVPPAPALRTVASVSYIPGTKIPAPPRSFGLAEAAGHGGRHVFLPSSGGLSPTAPGRLFDHYLSSMAEGGWTLAGKADPSRKGEWTLKWDFQQQSTLLTLYMIPKARFIVDDCPPEPYC